MQGEFEKDSERLNTYIQALATKLNFNQPFAPDDTFIMDLTFIHTLGPGTGHGKRYRPRCAAVSRIDKTSCITIKNKDELCSARATVTSNRAFLSSNEKPKHSIVLEEYHWVFVPSLNLHNSKKFSPATTFWSTWVPVHPTRSFVLSKEHSHYDSCNSFSGFMSKSYYCDECNREYNNNNNNNNNDFIYTSVKAFVARS